MRSPRAPASRWRALLLGIDPLTLAAVAALCALGIFNLVALGQTDLAIHQVVAVGVGLGLLAIASRTSSRNWPWLGRVIYAMALLMLLILITVGVPSNGARRWLSAGPLALQPSELAKLGMLLVLAQVLGSGTGVRRVTAAIALAVVPIGLTLLQPDLSTSLLLSVLLAAMLLLARTRLRCLALLMAGGAAVAPFAEHFLHPYQLQRLHAFLDGGRDAQGAGWTALQAHVAIGSGGLSGIDNSAPSHLLAQYLPARETDLAFASLVEQRGLLAGTAVLLATGVLVWRLALTAARTRDGLGALMAGGLAVLMGTEVSISVAGNLGLLPIAGVPCPLISYGGTSAVAHLAAIGLVAAARHEARRPRLSRPPRRGYRSPRLARTVALGLSAALVGLGYAGFQMQRSQGATLRRVGTVQMTRWVTLPATRGMITDRHGVPVAQDVLAAGVVVVPAVLRRDPSAPGRLAALLSITPAALEAMLGTSASEPSVRLRGDIPAATGAQITTAGIPGVLVVPSQRRQYRYGPMMAPLLGFAGVATPDDIERLGQVPPGSIIGRAGLEQQYDTVLRGTPGAQAVLVEPSGRPATMSTARPPSPGGDVRLTVDLGLQKAATDALATALRGVPGQPRGEQGAVVAMDPRTGEVLAMASLPAYDNNLYGPPIDGAGLVKSIGGAGNPALQHATQLAAPPGSTFKLVVGAADVVHGAIPPGRVIPTGASFQLGASVFHNWQNLPPQNLPQAIAWSNDVYFYKLALALGAQRIASVASELGAGRRTGVDLPGESAGFLGTPDSVAGRGGTWYSGSTVLMGIGQGTLTATPLQVARWTAGVATGSLVTPHLGLQSRPATASGYTAITPPSPAPLGFAGVLGPVRDGMRLGVTEGTGTLLRALPFPAGGKTGTAEDPSAPNGGPDAWYTAAAPMESPEIAVTVFVRGGGEGYYTAEPAALSILQYYAAHRAEVHAQAPHAQP
ncbi:MAG: FtsW/RodA/SpoVE family cell cycle protein [Candidatus Dormibacteria bacterium]